MKKTKIYLMALVALMITSFGAKAQGGLTPLVGSTHTYTVTATGTKAWTVSPGSGYTINSGAATSSVNITWTATGTYTLTFTETNASGCSTVKTTSIVVGLNTFDVSTASPTASCNTADGQANFSGSTTTTAITYTFNMGTGNPLWSPNWQFVFTLTPSSGATIANVATSAGTLSGSGPYTVTAIPSTSGAKTMTITMDVTGNIYTLNTVDLAITSAKELTYNTPDKDNDDWTATKTINPVPNTSSISTD
jgi:hypothetical protein